MKGEQVSPDNKRQVKNIYDEIRIMINHFIHLGYHEEVAFWRRILQAAKNSNRKADHS